MVKKRKIAITIDRKAGLIGMLNLPDFPLDIKRVDISYAKLASSSKVAEYRKIGGRRR